MESLSERLIRLRGEVGLGQKELADLSGVGYGSIQKWEQGKNKSITHKSAVKLAKCLPATATEIRTGNRAETKVAGDWRSLMLEERETGDSQSTGIPENILADLLTDLDYAYRNDKALFRALQAKINELVYELKVPDDPK